MLMFNLIINNRITSVSIMMTINNNIHHYRYYTVYCYGHYCHHCDHYHVIILGITSKERKKKVISHKTVIATVIAITIIAIIIVIFSYFQYYYQL